MHFLSWGDYSIPFDWTTYWAKHFYMWSFQSGTPNPDGLIRLPGRLLNFLVFGATDNVGLAYFYVFASLVVAFVSFFFFARKFLQIKRTSVQVIGALFFALNPIFLGNLAKVGLVLAAAMLPLCLLAIRATFVRKRFRYMILLFVCLNLSFLHPYTFTVNVVVSGAYFLAMAWQHRAWVRDVWPKFVLCGIFAVAINLYFVLPMGSMGTVSKDVISTNITPVAVDYTALVGVSNTGNLFTGFSLSKNVFVDFAFYNGAYQNIYFFGVFVFYVLLFGLYLLAERRLSLTDKRRLGVLFGGFLALLLLAATTVAHVDTIIKFLISMPGGWAFRSPLKWQLYIPLTLFGILVVLLNRVKGRVRLLGFLAVLLVVFVIMNGYLAVDIYAKLLTPRTPQYFAALQKMDMNNKTVLFVNNGECMDFMRSYPVITTELNQIFGSKNTQLKHVLEDSVDGVNLGSYDYVLGCEDRLGPELVNQYDFKPAGNFADNAFHLYANQKPAPPVAIQTQSYAFDNPTAISNKYQFAAEEMGATFSFVPDGSKHPATGLRDVFENLGPKNVQAGVMTASIPGDKSRPQQLNIRKGVSLYYGLSGNQLTLSATPRAGLQLANKTIQLPSADHYDVTYQDAQAKPNNLVSNGSFEQGLWQPAVGDCYAYDDQPSIGMQLTTRDKTDGRQALELSTRSHIACTGPNDIKVKNGNHYLLSFDYQSPDGGKYAGYYVSFDDPAETVLSERLQNNGSAWQSFSKEITVPPGAHALHLLLYAFPDSYGDRSHIARYDQVDLMAIPPAQDRLYLVKEPSTTLGQPQHMTYRLVNPTRKVVHISGTKQPFYLTTNETYNPLWQAELQNSAQRMQLPFGQRTVIASRDHLALNNTMNAWYVDPATLCQHKKECTQQPDGNYDFSLVLEFAPQRWFYLGGVISLASLIAGLAYFLYDRRNDGEPAEGRWRWHK